MEIPGPVIVGHQVPLNLQLRLEHMCGIDQRVVQFAQGLWEQFLEGACYGKRTRNGYSPDFEVGRSRGCRRSASGKTEPGRRHTANAICSARGASLACERSGQASGDLAAASPQDDRGRATTVRPNWSRRAIQLRDN